MKHRASAFVIAFFIAPVMLQSVTTTTLTSVASADTTISSASNDTTEQGTVTYQFFDIDTGEKIRDDETLTGKVGETWSYDPRQHVHDYQMPNDAAMSGTFTTKPQVVKTFFQPAKEGTLTVYYKYSDENAKSIKDTDTTTYGIWDKFEANINKFEMKDWKLDLDKSVYSLDFGGGVRISVSLRQLMGTDSLTDTVNRIQASAGYGGDTILGFDLVYTRVQSNVTANYVDENGNVLSDPKVMTGNIGDTYSFDTQDIEGYSLSSVSGPISGTYGSDDQTVTYVYKKNTQEVIHDNSEETDNSSESTSGSSSENDETLTNEPSKVNTVNDVNDNEVVPNSNNASDLGQFVPNTGEIASKTADLSQNSETPFNDLNGGTASNQNSLPNTGMKMTQSISAIGLGLLGLGAISFLSWRKKNI